MMKTSLCLILSFTTFVCNAGENADSTKARLKAGATFSLNSNGISSIPAFTLGDPALIASVSLARKRFSYEPVLAYGLDMRPWFIDNWLNYKIVDRTSFELKTGVNFSTFFSDYETPEKTVLQGQRYFAFALTGIYKFRTNSYLLLSYWHDRGQDEGTLRGHFVNLQGERTDIGLGKHWLVSALLQVFYINYDGNNDGLFLAPKVSTSVRNVPFSLFFQATQALVSNISPFPEFQWNIGLAYTL